VTRTQPLLLILLALASAGCTLSEFEDDPKPEPTPEIALAPPHMRRLLERQYVRSVRDLLGDAAAAAANPPADISAQGFEAIGASTLALSSSAVQQYETSARAIAAAARAASAFDAYLGCTPSQPADEACFQSFVETFGERAFRRPLESEELDRWTGVAMTAAQDPELGTFQHGLEWAAVGMLQSPNFIFQVEIGKPSDDLNRRLDGYEMATRLSFFLNDTTPDAALLDAAGDGDLDSASGIREAAEELLERPEAKLALRALYAERFLVRNVGGLQKDSDMFPDWDDVP
jgi:hypothetical protein